MLIQAITVGFQRRATPPCTISLGPNGGTLTFQITGPKVPGSIRGRIPFDAQTFASIPAQAGPPYTITMGPISTMPVVKVLASDDIIVTYFSPPIIATQPTTTDFFVIRPLPSSGAGEEE